MSRFATNSILGTDQIDERMKRVEEELELLDNNLDALYVKGRLRFDRAAPTSSSDVQTLDLLYDIVRDTNYEYVLINDAGNKRWRRITMSSF